MEASRRNGRGSRRRVIVAVPTLLAEGNPALGAVEKSAEGRWLVWKGRFVLVHPPGTTGGLARKTLDRTSGLLPSGSTLRAVQSGLSPVDAPRDGQQRLPCGRDRPGFHSGGVGLLLVEATPSLPASCFVSSPRWVRTRTAMWTLPMLTRPPASVSGPVRTRGGRIALANRQPRVNIHWPRLGVGGCCLPKDPWFLAEAAQEEASILPIIRRINDAQPLRAVRSALDLLREGATPTPAQVALGVKYRSGVDDSRETPVLPIADHPTFTKLSASHAKRLMCGRLVLGTLSLINRGARVFGRFDVAAVGVGR